MVACLYFQMQVDLPVHQEQCGFFHLPSLQRVWSKLCQFWPLLHDQYHWIEHASTQHQRLQQSLRSISYFSPTTPLGPYMMGWNTITITITSMMGWNTRTRSPRIQHSLASVEEEAERRRCESNSCGIKNIFHFPLLFTIFLFPSYYPQILYFYTRRWSRLGLNMHTFMYLATVATTFLVVFYLMFYFILSDIPA